MCAGDLFDGTYISAPEGGKEVGTTCTGRLLPVRSSEFPLSLAWLSSRHGLTCLTWPSMQMWEVPHGKNKGKLLVEWGAEMDGFDPATQIVERTVSMNLFNDQVGGSMTPECHHGHVTVENKVATRMGARFCCHSMCPLSQSHSISP